MKFPNFVALYFPCTKIGEWPWIEKKLTAVHNPMALLRYWISQFIARSHHIFLLILFSLFLSPVRTSPFAWLRSIRPAAKWNTHRARMHTIPAAFENLTSTHSHTVDRWGCFLCVDVVSMAGCKTRRWELKVSALGGEPERTRGALISITHCLLLCGERARMDHFGSRFFAPRTCHRSAAFVEQLDLIFILKRNANLLTGRFLERTRATF